MEKRRALSEKRRERNDGPSDRMGTTARIKLFVV
jgi:hypothetical protein